MERAGFSLAIPIAMALTASGAYTPELTGPALGFALMAVSLVAVLLMLMLGHSETRHRR